MGSDMPSISGAGIERGGGWNRKYKTRCPRCFFARYEVTDAYLSPSVTKMVTRTCAACGHRWDVASVAEYDENKKNVEPKSVFRKNV